ncbi:hypothetical protein V6N13_026455 [Hibiscus sabdariffa]|uniref:Uncharacterized protein n=1 Tax=Hibiscus sabdariffa TaxID=183260 RepID=A0ABR2P6V0_9ROSI
MRFGSIFNQKKKKRTSANSVDSSPKVPPKGSLCIQSPMRSSFGNFPNDEQSNLCCASMLDNVNQSFDPSREDPEMVPVDFPTTSEEGNNILYTGGPCFSEDDDKFTE